jgi:hypothetical protein
VPSAALADRFEVSPDPKTGSSDVHTPNIVSAPKAAEPDGSAAWAASIFPLASGHVTDNPEPQTAVASLGPGAAVPPFAPNADSLPPVAPPAALLQTEPAKEPRLTSAETALLLERGDRLFASRDIASARLFYERAAEAGDSHAALRLGASYDPAFLRRAQMRLSGAPKLAAYWYRRAQELGAREGEILLQGIETRKQQ